MALLGCDGATKAAPAAVAIEKMAVPLCLNERCGVLDQDGNVLVSFDSGYANILAADFKNKIFLGKDGFWSLASADGKTMIKPNVSANIIALTPGYFGFSRNGKYGVMDIDGNEVQKPRFDDIYPGGNDDFIIYEINGKRGILDAKAQDVSNAVYTTSVVYGDFRKRAMLIPAERDGENWLIDLKSKRQFKTAYADVAEFSDGHAVVLNKGRNLSGLVDANGAVVVGLRYQWIGTPSAGLVAFREKADGACGYMDYAGKVVIDPKYAQCLAFGTKGALAQERSANGEGGKFGMIDTHGNWVLKPAYDFADSAGLTSMGYQHDVPGYAAIGVKDGPFSIRYGIFNTDEGKVQIEPVYTQIGALGKGLFVFSDEKSPMVAMVFMDSHEQVSSVGIMDIDRKRLVEPSQFISASLDASGRFVQMVDGISKTAKVGLYDLQGHQVVPGKWEKLVVDTERGYILGYTVTAFDDGQTYEAIGALYDLQGKLRFSVETTSCGAKQVLDSGGKVIWPTEPQKYCPKG